MSHLIKQTLEVTILIFGTFSTFYKLEYPLCHQLLFLFKKYLSDAGAFVLRTYINQNLMRKTS